MKNNRLTNTDLFELRREVREIRRLASLEGTNFNPFNPTQDEAVKQQIRPWLMWFDIVADKIEGIIGPFEDEGGCKS